MDCTQCGTRLRVIDSRVSVSAYKGIAVDLSTGPCSGCRIRFSSDEPLCYYELNLYKDGVPKKILNESELFLNNENYYDKNDHIDIIEDKVKSIVMANVGRSVIKTKDGGKLKRPDLYRN